MVIRDLGSVIPANPLLVLAIVVGKDVWDLAGAVHEKNGEELQRFFI